MATNTPPLSDAAKAEILDYLLATHCKPALAIHGPGVYYLNSYFLRGATPLDAVLNDMLVSKPLQEHLDATLRQ